MDDTQASSRPDTAATRKRRSSILKNQRPPRTPFSEVEFNVATPTDTTKSRRVSFSRKTGVAEFVTNEATTTWKIFYEEHNKSLESSGNDSVANGPRQTIEHIGKRIFDQQFEEVEIVDIDDAAPANPLKQFEASFNKINLTQQLASQECVTDDLKFVAPQPKFEQSALINVSAMKDMTNPIIMNLSALPNTSTGDKCDDLDEIQKDLKRSKPSDLCPGPMRAGKDFSGFIEVVDLNTTHGVIQDDGSEMSITETIEGPRVEKDSIIKDSVQKLTLGKLDGDWINDKENIAINPYIAPKESLNFKVNDASNEVLVFDGKRLTTQPIPSSISGKENFRQTLLPNAPINPPQRKTIVLNVNDDLPNFIENVSIRANHVNDYQPSVFEHVNMSITTAIDNQIKVSNNTNITNSTINNDFSVALKEHKTNEEINRYDMSNISFTQAIPSNIISTEDDTGKQNNGNALNKRNITIHYDNMTQNISMTQAIPNNIIHICEEKELATDKCDKRKTIIFNSDSCDISMTNALPTNININEIKNHYLICNDVPQNSAHENPRDIITKEKRTTIIFDNDSCDISMTQILPTNINVECLEIKNKNQIDSKHSGGIIPKEKRETIVFDNDSCNLSITQALPTNLNFTKNESRQPCAKNNEESTKDKRNTLIFGRDSCDISMTQCLPTNINVNNEKTEEKQGTIGFDYNSCDMSMTQILLSNINVVNEKTDEKQETIGYDYNSCDMSMTQILLSNINVNNEKTEEKQGTIVFDHNACDISMAKILPTNINVSNEEADEKRRTIMYDTCDVSLTQILPSKMSINIDIPVDNEQPNNHILVVSSITDNQTTVFSDKYDTGLKAHSPYHLNKEATKYIQPDPKSNVISAQTIIYDKMNITTVDDDGNNKSLQQSVLKNLNTTLDNKHTIRTNPIPSNVIDIQKDLSLYKQANDKVSKSEHIEIPVNKMSATEVKQNIFVYQVNTSLQAREEIDERNIDINVKEEGSQLMHDDDDATSSSVQDIYSINNYKSKSLLEPALSMFSEEDDLKCNLDITESRYNLSKSKKSILDELLDMSCESNRDDSTDTEVNGNITIPASQTGYKTRKEAPKSALTLREQLSKPNAKNSFAVKSNNTEKEKSLAEKAKNHNSVTRIEKKSNECKTLFKETNKDYHVLVSEEPNFEYNAESDKSLMLLSEQLMNTSESSRKSFQNANNTTELLKMLSVYTSDNESLIGKAYKTEDWCEHKHNETGKSSKSMKYENINNMQEPKRLSLPPKRQSIAISREDILNNLSMAKVALQQSRFEVDETDNMDDTSESINMVAPNNLDKSHRMSSDVVKTLQFEDESASDTSLKSEQKKSQLRMVNTFGDPTRLNEGKDITAGLRDVSENIKELMHDLVQPFPDEPCLLENFIDTKSSISICSNEVQADLMPSSQIDVNVENLSDDSNSYKVKMYKNVTTEANSFNYLQDVKNYTTPGCVIKNNKRDDHVVRKPACMRQNNPEPVLIFSLDNPLKNIFLPPYNLRRIYDVCKIRHDAQNLLHTIDEVKINDEIKQLIQYRAELEPNTKRKDKNSLLNIYENCILNVDHQNSIKLKMDVVDNICETSGSILCITDARKPLSVSKCVQGDTIPVKNVQVNTLIKMKENKELIEASSTLTLVEESPYDSEHDTCARNSFDRVNSFVEVIFRSGKDSCSEIASEVTTLGEPSSVNNIESRPAQKRSYSPTKDRDTANVEVAPKPSSKIQKKSNTSLPTSTNKTFDKKFETQMTCQCNDIQNERTNIVQSVNVEYQYGNTNNFSTTYSQISHSDTERVSTTSVNSTDTSSTASSTPDPNSTAGQVQMSRAASQISEFTCERILQITEKENYYEIIKNLNELSFMGTAECQWDRSPAGSWWFRLMGDRVHLRLRLDWQAPLDVDVGVLPTDDCDPLAAMCVQLVADAMRYEGTRVSMQAADTAQLLRRCVAISRLARRWARVMRDAQIRLAYHVLPGGHISLRVANFPQRYVWEMHMHVSLQVGSEGSGAYPRARDITVHAHVGAHDVGSAPVPPSPAELQRIADAPPPNWGHVPRTLWRVFRYLKNLSRDKDLLGI